MGNKGAGRPNGSYRYLHPETNKPITAIEYHKTMKDAEKLKRSMKDSTNLKISRQLNEKAERTIDILIEIRAFINNLIKKELN